MDFAFLPIIALLVIAAFWFLIGLLFLMIASRVVTRVVLDEIDKDRRRRGPV